MARDSVLERLKGSRRDEGLFTLFQDTLTGSLLMYVKKGQLGPEYIYQSFSMGGPAFLFLNQSMLRQTWAFNIRKKFEKLEFVRANTNFYYDPQSKLSKAANVDVADAVFFSDKIAFKDSILSRSSGPKLIFGNDADITYAGSGIDPRVMTWDMSNDMVKYAGDRFQLVNNLMGKIKDRYARTGNSYQNLLQKYYNLAYQRYGMASALSHYTGGIYVDRSFVGQEGAPKQPFTPVPADYQKKVLQTLNAYIFSPAAFDADTYLFPCLQQQRRGFNFFGRPEDPKPEQIVLAVQSSVLNYVLFPATLRRINSSTLYGNTYSAADVLRDMNSSLFDADLKGNLNLYRQNIQTEYVKKIGGADERQ